MSQATALAIGSVVGLGGAVLIGLVCAWMGTRLGGRWYRPSKRTAEARQKLRPPSAEVNPPHKDH